jgi:hypothetical protein
MVPKIKIWSTRLGEAVSKRHEYAAYIAFEVILGWEFEWCGPTEWQRVDEGIQLQYGGEKPEGSSSVLWIPDAGLLSATGAESIGLKWSDASRTPGRIRLPFGVQDEGKDEVESDWLSWVFWMASRMEEYERENEASRDSFGRFKGTDSLAYKEGWLQHPILEKCVRSWAKQFAPNFPLPLGYRVQATIDVDSAFAYRHKGLKLTVGASLNDLIRGRWARFFERPGVMFGLRQDPYDTYEWLEEVHSNAGLRAQYFFLLANRGKRDRGVPWKSSKLRQRIQALSTSADIAVHPGVFAHDASTDDVMKEELRRLSVILQSPVHQSRQHYLLQRNPASWRRLERLQVENDHSLGYADSVGFRAGMSRPFKAYDLVDERIMNLVLHPIAIMDATLMRYLKLNPKEALEVVQEISSNVRDVHGVLVLLWHNESVSDCGQWRGWKSFYQEVLAAVALK